MKAALYQGVHNVEIVDLPDYECGDDAIILKNIYSSICGTDVAVYNHGLGLGHRVTIGGEFGQSMGINGVAIDCDIWIDAAGADSVLNTYEKVGKYNSRMVLVAVGTNRREIDVLGLTFGQKSITGSGGYTPQDVKDVLEIMKSQKWDIEKMITDEYILDDLAEAIEKASDVNSALNVVIRVE